MADQETNPIQSTDQEDQVTDATTPEPQQQASGSNWQTALASLFGVGSGNNQISDSSQPNPNEGRSPLQRQRHDQRSQPRYKPIKITFLEGSLIGESLDIGLAVNELSESQTASWSDQDADGIRANANFKNISAREFTLSLEYLSLKEDIQFLSENVAHLMEITSETKAPPKLLFDNGRAAIAPVVCTSINWKLDVPHPRRKGWRHCKVDLNLKLLGGKDSSHALAPPLLPTPLGDIREQTTDAERQRRGQAATTEMLLVPCIGEEGSEQISDMILNGQLRDPEAIANIDSGAFVQAAIGGYFPADILQNEELTRKLQQDLALEMARGENGIGDDVAFANALLSGDPSALPSNEQESFTEAHESFLMALDAIATQDLGENAAIFEAGNPAGERVRSGFGSCGMSIRASGVSQAESAMNNSGANEAQTLVRLNDHASELSSDQLAEQLNIDEESARRIRDGLPYQSREEFIGFMSDRQGSAGAAYAVWGKIENWIPEPVETSAA